MACWEVHKFFWSVPHLVQWFSHFNALLVKGFSQPAMLEDTGGYPHCLPVLTHGIHVSFSVDQITIQSLLFLLIPYRLFVDEDFSVGQNPHYLTIVPSHCCLNRHSITIKAASNHKYVMSPIPHLGSSPWKIPMKSWKITIKNHHQNPLRPWRPSRDLLIWQLLEVKVIQGGHLGLEPTGPDVLTREHGISTKTTGWVCA